MDHLVELAFRISEKFLASNRHRREQVSHGDRCADRASLGKNDQVFGS